jgi:hypothetical protein
MILKLWLNYGYIARKHESKLTMLEYLNRSITQRWWDWRGVSYTFHKAQALIIGKCDYDAIACMKIQ